MTEDKSIVAASGWSTNTIAMQIDRGMAIAMGYLEPTAQERADIARDREKWRAESARVQQVMGEYGARLDALTDPVARALLDLHAPEERTWTEQPECVGCDFAGWESEPPGWPCRTVRLIGEQHGIQVPEGVWWG